LPEGAHAALGPVAKPCGPALMMICEKCVVSSVMVTSIGTRISNHAAFFFIGHHHTIIDDLLNMSEDMLVTNLNTSACH
jgi:hypothetical protein